MLVDDEDFEALNAHVWRLAPNGYAIRTAKSGAVRTTVSGHREVMRLVPGDGKFIDHKNGVKLDNRKENLRSCTNRQNQWNQKAHKDGSGLKGVCFDKKSLKWQASIKNGAKVKYLGQFETAELAHEVYCLAADMLYGEFANHG